MESPKTIKMPGLVEFVKATVRAGSKKRLVENTIDDDSSDIVVSVLSNSIFSYCSGDLAAGNYFCDGSELKLLSSFARSINKTLKFTKPADWRYGARDANGTWNGHLGLIAKGAADLAVGGITHTAVRNEDFGFSHMVHGTYYTFTSGKPGFLPPSTAVYRTFSWDLWIWTLVTFFVLSAFYHVISKAVAKIHEDYKGSEDATFKLFVSIIRQSFDDAIEAKYRPKAWFLMCYFIAHGFLGMAYQAAILAFLVSPLRYPGIHYLDEAVTKTQKPFLISKWDFALQDMFASSNNSLYQRIRNERRLTLCGDTCDPYINDTIFYFGDIHVTKLILANLSNYGMVYDIGRETIRPTSFAWPMRKNSYLRPIIDNFILWAEAMGLPDHYLQMEIQKKFPPEQRAPPPDTSSQAADEELMMSLTLGHLEGAWALWAAGLVASVVGFLWEWVKWLAGRKSSRWQTPKFIRKISLYMQAD